MYWVYVRPLQSAPPRGAPICAVMSSRAKPPYAVILSERSESKDLPN